MSHGDLAYSAFVPNPLPPVVAPDAALMRVLADASYALGELAAKLPLVLR